MNIPAALLQLFLISILWIAGPVLAASDAPTSIKLVSEEWEGSTDADGSGLYWKIIKKVYEPAGIKMSFEMVPYMRSVQMVKQKEADAWVGSYIDEEDGVLYPKWHFDADIVWAVFKKGGSFEGKESLQGKQVGWIRGYDYDSYISVPMEKKELNSRESGLKMVEMGRLDYFMDAMVEIKNTLAKPEFKNAPLAHDKVLQLNLYLAFANNARGQALMKIWDERFPKLLESGELKKLFEAHDWPTYPFEKP